jgi:hypothetical protein
MSLLRIVVVTTFHILAIIISTFRLAYRQSRHLLWWDDAFTAAAMITDGMTLVGVLLFIVSQEGSSQWQGTRLACDGSSMFVSHWRLNLHDIMLTMTPSFPRVRPSPRRSEMEHDILLHDLSVAGSPQYRILYHASCAARTPHAKDCEVVCCRIRGTVHSVACTENIYLCSRRILVS